MAALAGPSRAAATIIPRAPVAIVSEPSPEIRALKIVGSAGGPERPTSTLRKVLYGLLGGLTALLIAAAAIAVIAVKSKPTLHLDTAALARYTLPFGSGNIERISVVGGRQGDIIPFRVKDDHIWPEGLLPVNYPVTIVVTVKRPGWISWLAGSTQRLQVNFVTPAAHLRSHYLTVADGAPLQLRFREPVSVFEAGSASRLGHHTLSSPKSTITLPVTGAAGTEFVAAAPRSWEAPAPRVISWFPAGSTATAIASPSPGTQIGPQTPIKLTFSKAVSKVLGHAMPVLTPSTQGAWHVINRRTIEFEPQGYGYGLGASVRVAVPSGVRLFGGTQTASDPSASWSVPAGSTMRLQQLLAQLGYLPLNFNAQGTPVANTLEAQETAAAYPPKGSFTWKYPNTPSQLEALWQPGSFGVVTRGAVMAFENDHGLTTDGAPGPSVWKALFAAVLSNHVSTFGYTYVLVHEQSSDETEDVWHNGHVVITTPVNTGIPEAPTATGIFPVYLRFVTTTMSGLNPDGSHYSDPGIPWVSYFNGGDALHGFVRGSYGFPQSLGCVEEPIPVSGKIWPYTPIGTLVDVL
jgi:peptidoglycan hydrolase-like protein with peptidoglycan-binding domain